MTAGETPRQDFITHSSGWKVLEEGRVRRRGGGEQDRKRIGIREEGIDEGENEGKE